MANCKTHACVLSMTNPDTPSGSNVVAVNNAMMVRESQEPGVLINARQYKRYLDRLEDCTPSGWSDLWLALTGIGGGLAITAFVTRLTLPSTAAATPKTVTLMLTVLGVVCFILCIIGYLTQRQQHGKEIKDLKTDLEMHTGPR